MNETEDLQPQVPDEPDRLVAALREYQAALDRGEKPSRRELLGRYPDVADELGAALAGLDFLNSAGQRLRPSASAPAPPPEGILGDFRLVREIGRGGMGIVYEAVQISLGRRVALKVLPFAATLDPRRLRRFHTEAHAAAQLHHTNIVPVYFVGEERGVHFYAMQLIEGQSLAGVARQVSDSGPSSDDAVAEPGRETRSAIAATLSSQRAAKPRDYFRTVAELIAQAAEALEHAHQFGIVHRDVKPANLLVDARGRLWVTDFGLAQVNDGADLTRTGDLVGTLRYMSPEQADGQGHLVDCRTDVYSLGATLYELATLATIFPGHTQAELLQQILHREPKSPRALNRSVPVELETIILKSVSKAPADRYATAQELADDLRRFLADRPVLARRPTAIDRARKWSRRHPAAMWGGLLALLLCAAGLAASTLLIASEQGRTREALARERQRAEEAEQQFRLARRSVDALIQLSEAELADNPFLLSLRRRSLETALAYYQEFLEQRGHDPAEQAELQATRDRVKQIVDDLVVLQGAGQIFLLSEPAVLSDLKASEQQREQLVTLLQRQSDRRDKELGEFFRLSDEEKQRRFLALAQSNQAAVAAILRPEQLTRLRQIALQSQGAGAFRDPDVTAELQLTAEQRTRIRAVEWELFAGPLGGPGGGPRRGPPGGGPPKKMPDSWHQAALDKILAILTKEQLARWEALTGERFRGDFHFRPPPGGGPGGPKPPG